MKAVQTAPASKIYMSYSPFLDYCTITEKLSQTWHYLYTHQFSCYIQDVHGLGQMSVSNSLF